MFRRLLLAFAPLLIAASPAAWDPSPWLADLAQIRVAIDRDYPNRDWLTGERDVSLDRWFDRAAAAIRASSDDAGARSALSQLAERFADGHVALRWPEPPHVGSPAIAGVPTTTTAASAPRADTMRRR